IKKEQTETRKNARASPLQPSGLADSEQLPHDQCQVEATGVHQQTLQDVVPSFQMHTSHSAGFVHVRHTSFRQFTTFPLEPLAALSLNSPSVVVHLLLLVLFPIPVPPTPSWLRNVTTAVYRMQVLHDGSAVVP